ncbi:hypothetical protein RJ641_020640 [Dillenia turbinata]|uniref:Uncharacterized protein n=1 Tax=Dillenia turbinata TaxID=194707 RepID=A0AAN8UT77_9MAGN
MGLSITQTISGTGQQRSSSFLDPAQYPRESRPRVCGLSLIHTSTRSRVIYMLWTDNGGGVGIERKSDKHRREKAKRHRRPLARLEGGKDFENLFIDACISSKVRPLVSGTSFATNTTYIDLVSLSEESFSDNDMEAKQEQRNESPTSKQPKHVPAAEICQLKQTLISGLRPDTSIKIVPNKVIGSCSIRKRSKACHPQSH